MSQNQNLLYTYLLPILLTVALLVTSVLLGIVNISNLLLASLLFCVIGLAVFFTELLAAKVTRGVERQETYTLISDLLLRDRANGVANVLTLEEVLAIETAADEVWIYAYDLAWEGEDSVFPNLVYRNLKRGVKYLYIVPNNKQVHLRVNSLRHKYGNIKNIHQLIRFKSRPRDLKLVQFGITIYNPSVLNRNATTDCVAVFFPHYNFYGPKTDSAPFIAIKGTSTVEIQEGFLELWNEAADVPMADNKA